MMRHLLARADFRLPFREAAAGNRPDHLMLSQPVSRARFPALKIGLAGILHALFWSGFILVMIWRAPSADLSRPSVESLSQVHQEKPASAPSPEPGCAAPCVSAVWTERVMPPPYYRISPSELPPLLVRQEKIPPRDGAKTSRHTGRKPSPALTRGRPRHRATGTSRRR